MELEGDPLTPTFSSGSCLDEISTPRQLFTSGEVHTRLSFQQSLVIDGIRTQAASRWYWDSAANYTVGLYRLSWIEDFLKDRNNLQPKKQVKSA